MRDRIPLFLFVASGIFLVFSYGVLVGEYHIFPYWVVAQAKRGFQELQKMNAQALPWYFRKIEDRGATPLSETGQAYQGLNLVTKITIDHELVAEIRSMNGEKLHEWQVDWFKIWPDAEHVPERLRPQSKPGTQILGSLIMDNGDLVFNFEGLGLVRLDLHGKVVWRLPYLTHHSVHQHDDGNLWVCGQKEHPEYDERFPNRTPPFLEFTLLEVTPSGMIVQEWSVAELLHKNDLGGLLYLGSLKNRSTQVGGGGDLLHLNDVEPFPATMKENFFRQGDILVSLRNINTVFVFNRDSGRIKFISTGQFVRQHDPDFISGNSFSVFDNNLIASEDHGQQSRILIITAPDHTVEVFFQGNQKFPFYTDIVGKQQWLPNGNLLITESMKGKAFEINRQGEMVWEYVNYVAPETVGILGEVQRLPLDYSRLFEEIRSNEPKGSG